MHPTNSGRKNSSSYSKKKKRDNGRRVENPAAIVPTNRSGLLSVQEKKLLLESIFLAKKLKCGSKLDTVLKSDPTLSSVKISRKDIPYWDSRFSKGTQAPTIRLYLTPTTVTTNGSGVIVGTYEIEAQFLENFANLAQVFDEYRVIDGEIQYDANHSDAAAANSIQGFSVGVIDYGDVTALSSFTEGAQYDAKKFFYGVVRAHSSKTSPVKWKMQFSMLPDQEWIPVATTTQTFCTWKCYSYQALAANNASIGVLNGHVDVQFRGSD